MKKWLVFGGGFLSGVVLTFLILLIIGLANSNNNGLIGATYFDKPAEEINVDSFEVMQVIQDNAALVRSKDFSTYGTIYLLVNDSGRYYYDDEIINISGKQKVMHIGIYKYDTKSGIEKTVPIIRVFDK